MARPTPTGPLDLIAERMFLAVALDEESRHALASHLLHELDGAGLPGKAVPPQNWHLTLRFLGPTEPARAERVLALLDERIAVKPFRLRLGELGAFPSPRKASVLWLGVGGDTGSLEAVAAECEAAAVGAGFEPEGRPFHPHLTLSRIRPPRDVGYLCDRVPAAGIRFDVGQVTLFRSVLGSGPARYEVVDGVEL